MKTTEKKLALLNKPNESNAETAEKTDNPAPSLSVNSPLCQRNCSVCLSPYIQEIHDMKLNQRLQYRDISKKLMADYGVKMSHVAIWSHFSKYNENIKNLTNSEIVKFTNSQIDFRSKHISQLNDLINSMFVKISANWGTLTPSIESLTQLVKLRYQVMEGQIDPDSFDDQVRVLIQNAEKINNVAGQSKFEFMRPSSAMTQDERKKAG